MSWGYDFRPYVPVGAKKARAARYARERAEQLGRPALPVSIQGIKIAKTFWGKAWCDHLERFSDFANRLPRGRTYVRNGSVADLQISPGRLEAIVAGSEPYEVVVEIERLPPIQWQQLRRECAASIDSLLDLLSGRLSDGAMQRLTDRNDGLFPTPSQIKLGCSCPDWAIVCKHVAAVLYAVGARLDERPDLLFVLRDVDHHELVSDAISQGNLDQAFGAASNDLAGEDLESLFGIELDSGEADASPSKTSHANTTRKAAKKRSRKGATKKSARQSTPASQANSVGKNFSKKKQSSTKRASTPKKQTAAKKTSGTRTTAEKFGGAAGTNGDKAMTVVQKATARKTSTKKSASPSTSKPSKKVAQKQRPVGKKSATKNAAIEKKNAILQSAETNHSTKKKAAPKKRAATKTKLKQASVRLRDTKKKSATKKKAAKKER